MAAHMSADGNRIHLPRGSWLTLSAAFTEIVADLADREDLTVTCTPGAGRGAPGCFLPALASIELDGDHLRVDPATCDPLRSGDCNRYPALWGVLTHEAAHAHHTRWTAALTAANGPQAAHVEAAILLEESRIEAGQLRRRPADRRWLRSSATQIVMDGFTTSSSQTMTEWEAAHAAGLLLARRDAGVFTAAEVTAAQTLITGTLGAHRMAELQAIWIAAHSTGDDDHVAMLELGRRWCDVVGVEPDQPSNPSLGGPGSAASGNQAAGSPGGQGAPKQAPSPIAKAVGAAVTKVEAAERRAHKAEAAAAHKAAAAIAEAEKAREEAARVFGAAPGGGRGLTAIAGSRKPTTAEQSAARQLARLLRVAAHRERAATVTASATPPGRLRMRGALAADAQRAAGQVPTAEPFLRTSRRHIPNPPLHLGVACDVSGSMKALAGPIASAAYILGRAAAHVPDARAATVIYGHQVRAVTAPGKPPQQVRNFPTNDAAHAIGSAVQTLDIALGLTRPGAARLLVIVSDGLYSSAEWAVGQKEITRLVRSGCAVLWLALDDANHMDGTHLVKLTDPAQAAATIGQAAVRALRTA